MALFYLLLLTSRFMDGGDSDYRGKKDKAPRRVHLWTYNEIKEMKCVKRLQSDAKLKISKNIERLRLHDLEKLGLAFMQNLQ